MLNNGYLEHTKNSNGVYLYEGKDGNAYPKNNKNTIKPLEPRYKFKDEAQREKFESDDLKRFNDWRKSQGHQTVDVLLDTYRSLFEEYKKSNDNVRYIFELGKKWETKSHGEINKEIVASITAKHPAGWNKKKIGMIKNWANWLAKKHDVDLSGGTKYEPVELGQLFIKYINETTQDVGYKEILRTNIRQLYADRNNNRLAKYLLNGESPIQREKFNIPGKQKEVSFIDRDEALDLIVGDLMSKPNDYTGALNKEWGITNKEWALWHRLAHATGARPLDLSMVLTAKDILKGIQLHTKGENKGKVRNIFLEWEQHKTKKAAEIDFKSEVLRADRGEPTPGNYEGKKFSELEADNLINDLIDWTANMNPESALFPHIRKYAAQDKNLTPTGRVDIDFKRPLKDIFTESISNAGDNAQAYVQYSKSLGPIPALTLFRLDGEVGKGARLADIWRHDKRSKWAGKLARHDFGKKTGVTNNTIDAYLLKLGTSKEKLEFQREKVLKILKELGQKE